MHRARTAFQNIRNRADQEKTNQQFHQMMRNSLAFQRDDAKAPLRQKREISDEKREQQ